jgi:HemY protein
MSRLILFLLGIVAIASGLAWLADRPGDLLIHWEGYEIETSVFRGVVIFTAFVALIVFLWSILRQIWQSPAAIGSLLVKRRQKRGLDALSSGMIAIGAGDRSLAARYALQARKSLPNEPLTHLLRAQTAQLSGDRETARRIFEAMLGSPDTEQLGLRGLFLEAQREGETEAARQFAERALQLNPKLGWSADSLFEIQCKLGDWPHALETLAIQRRHGLIDKAVADRRRGVLLAGQAQDLEDSDPEKALTLALEAHALAPDLVPAAAVAGRLLAARGNTPRAAKVLQKTWARSPHPDLATAYAYARIGDSPRDRLDRVKQLAMLAPHSIESPIAVAIAAIEARQFADARYALEPLLDGRLTQRVATLMARIESEEHGDKGRVREWLARAVNAPRDPAWTADGIVSDRWVPVSPVTGALDAFQWKVPVETLEQADADLVARKLEELVPLGAPASEPQNAPSSAQAATRPASSKAAVQDLEIIDADETAQTEPESKTTPTAAAHPAPAAEQPATPKTERTATARADTPARKPQDAGEPASAPTPAAAPRQRAQTESRSNGATPATAQPTGGKRAAQPPRRAAEPKIFVPPHAPDDPGPEENDLDPGVSLNPYRMPG